MAEIKEKRPVWQVRDLDPKVRKRVRIYAVKNNLNLAQAVERIVELALGKKN